ncbi:MAG: hypothetical protein KAG66_20595, partial [Methylococcales bacterium]|nr:hypothetical protein [Methylococcales bacterium]
SRELRETNRDQLRGMKSPMGLLFGCPFQKRFKREASAHLHADIDWSEGSSPRRLVGFSGLEQWSVDQEWVF